MKHKNSLNKKKARKHSEIFIALLLIASLASGLRGAQPSGHDAKHDLLEDGSSGPDRPDQMIPVGTASPQGSAACPPAMEK